jgi:hypothetical protein
MSYNGWSNYETWNVSLWYGDLFASLASEQKLYGDYLEELVVEMEMGSIPESSLAADILNASLRRIDWEELADHYNADSDYEDEDVLEDLDA